MVTTVVASGTVMNAREAAASLGATTGKLQGKRDGKEWAVKVSELEHFKRQHLAALAERLAGVEAPRTRADYLGAF